MPKIEIYTTSTCPYCIRAKSLLQQKGLPYEETNVEAPEIRAKMSIRANGARTVPQIFINGSLVGGCDDLYALDAAGKLNSMLTA